MLNSEYIYSHQA